MVRGVDRKDWMGEPKQLLTLWGLMTGWTGEFRRKEKACLAGFKPGSLGKGDIRQARGGPEHS